MLEKDEVLKIVRLTGSVWGIVGVSLLIGSAMVRVLPHAVDAFKLGLTPMEWILLLIWSGFMLITEGYRGFQKLFSPRVASRAWYLVKLGRPFDLIMAPLFCMGYFRAPRRRIITSWTLTLGIILIIAVVHFLSQPWRGILDCGVLLGLGYGLVWLFVFVIITIKRRDYVVDPEVK